MADAKGEQKAKSSCSGNLEKNRAAENEGERAYFTDVELGTITTDPVLRYASYAASGTGLTSKATLTEDGRIVVSLNLKRPLPDLPTSPEGEQAYAPKVQEDGVDEERWKDVPKLSIVIMIVGSRGDVQPYLALAKVLHADGHRVRIATHETFRVFVQESVPGLEFFDISGDPKELMSYMVKNPGLIPGFDSLTNGDIGRKRKMLAEIFNGCWRACHAPDPKDPNATPFAADAIIANPPSFAHVHCAEALGVPVMLTFTMPWTPTRAFPHPLVNIKSSNAEPGLTNYFSYVLADLLTWQGVNDLLNALRTRILGLSSLTTRSGAGLVDRLKVPWTYCISPALVEQPRDWSNHIDTVGFYFLDLATSYKPPDDLMAFLDAGPPPVYIGFGSVVVDDPVALSQTIFDATLQAGVRALVSAGWGGLSSSSVPDHIFMLENVPHDWLFSRVAAVVHHGGAGTTAIGLRMGCPTVVVPFFGDQLFWGMMIENAGIGPKPIPHKELTVENLRDALKYALSPEAQAAAKKAAEKIEHENGVQRGVESFYRHLPLLNMRCDLDPSRVAVWWSTRYCLRLSAFAAETLINARKVDLKELDVHRTKEYESRKEISDPVTGGASAIFWTVTNWYTGIAQIFYNPKKGIVKTTKAIPAGVLDIILSMHEGLHNAPKLYGSDVRERSTVTDFSSGLKEAGKGFFYGYYDGITGLVREPVQGAKKEGFIGAIKGSARSFFNVNMRPAAGIVGLIANPAQGAWASIRGLWGSGSGPPQPHRETRISEGKQMYSASTQGERDAIISAFERLSASTTERQKGYAEVAREEITKRQAEDEIESAEVSTFSAEV